MAVIKYLPREYDWRLLKAQLWQESRLRTDQVSPAGAKGIGQIMDDTWEQWSVKTGFKDHSVTEPRANIYTAANYLGWLINEWNWERHSSDRYCLALASYNAGIGHILKAQAKADDSVLYKDIIEKLPEITGDDNAAETIRYVSNILFFCSGQIVGNI